MATVHESERWGLKDKSRWFWHPSISALTKQKPSANCFGPFHTCFSCVHGACVMNAWYRDETLDAPQCGLHSRNPETHALAKLSTHCGISTVLVPTSESRSSRIVVEFTQPKPRTPIPLHTSRSGGGLQMGQLEN